MRRLTFIGCLALTIAMPASAETRVFYARPDKAPEGATYLWDGSAVTAPRRLREVLDEVNRLGSLPPGPVEIRLTALRGAPETVYPVSRTSFVAIEGWRGSPKTPLVFRGQVTRAGTKPRALTTIEGPSLATTLCSPRPADCAPPDALDIVAGIDGPAANRGRESLDQLWLAYQDPPAALSGRLFSVGEQLQRVSCLRVDGSRHVEFTDLGLRDCWLPALLTFGSQNIALRNSVIQGSSYVFAAFPELGLTPRPETAHSFEVTGNYWEQSPARYRAAKPSCDKQRNWDCPVSIWSDLPWGVTHGFFWEPLNGALFGSRDILGNVKVADNVIIDAYNGVRMKVSDECLTRSDCGSHTNIGVEIARNTFINVRDNPVEPEGHAFQWIVKQNNFKNVYGAISTDGTAGREFLVFGNVLDFDDIPGRDCTNVGWSDSRKFIVTAQGGTWGPTVTDAVQDDLTLKGEERCDTHRRGVFIKTGWEDATKKPPNRLLERIYVFNNSLRTRSPLFARRPSSPLTSLNNAVVFAGCGPTGDILCRQEPASEPECLSRRRWTNNGQALYADCFDLTPATIPGHSGPVGPHVFARNAFSLALDPAVAAVEVGHRVIEGEIFEASGASGGDARRLHEEFRLPAGSALRTAGCALAYKQGTVDCTTAQGPVGAIQPDGTRFDLALPFSYPFAAALTLAQR